MKFEITDNLHARKQMLLHQLAIENKDVFGLMMSMMNETKITLETKIIKDDDDDESQIFNICFTTFQQRTVIPICEICRDEYGSHIMNINEPTLPVDRALFIDSLQQVAYNLRYKCFLGHNTLIDIRKDRVILNKTRISANAGQQAQVRKLIRELYEILMKEFPEKD